MGVPWPQLGSSIRQLALLVSALGWVCPARQMSLSFLQEGWEGSRPLGEVGSLVLPLAPHSQGHSRQREAPSENPSHLRPPASYLKACGGATPFCSLSVVLPQSGEEVPRAVGFGDRKPALGALSVESGGGERKC